MLGCAAPTNWARALRAGEELLSMPNTVAVAVTFTLNSTNLVGTPPYNISACSGTISFDNNTSSTIAGFGPENIGTPVSGGASFSLTVVDSGYSSPLNATSIGNWALTCIPRGATTQASPFGNNVNTITGKGATGTVPGTFLLDIGNNKIKQLGPGVSSGNWDWSLMVQINVGNTIHCYGSDPEMDVGS